MADTISWTATIATIIAASITAANLGSRITGYGFVIFTFGALCWIAVGALDHQAPLMWTNIVLTILDIFGIWRWLGRQAEVEKGARAAAQASAEQAAETLFPISLLSSAPVTKDGTELGHCIDAMKGCASGRIGYVVVSQGGLAGVGETLRKLPWRNARVDEQVIVTDLAAEQFLHLEILPRDQWPAR